MISGVISGPVAVASERLIPQMMNLQPDVQPAVQIHCLSVAAAALGEKRVAGAELTSCGRPMRPVCQPTELFGEHRESAQVLSTPVQHQFSGYEACRRSGGTGLLWRGATR